MIKESVYGAIIDVKGSVNQLIKDLMEKKKEHRIYVEEYFSSLMIEWLSSWDERVEWERVIPQLHRANDMAI